MANLAVSVVLYRPDLGKLEETFRTLTSAIRHAKEHNIVGQCHLLLTDHSHVPATEEIQRGWRALLKNDIAYEYYFANQNPGFGCGHNRAFSRLKKSTSEADFFLIANPDLVFAQDSLLEGIAFLDKHKSIGLLAPAILEGNALRPACFRYPDIMTLLIRMFDGNFARTRMDHYECRDWEPGLTVFNPEIISGCCMLFRSETFSGLGMFDERYFLYFEDFDLSLKAGKRGLSAYFPKMQVRHGGGGASRKGLRHIYWYAQSARLFFETHGLRWF